MVDVFPINLDNGEKAVKIYSVLIVSDDRALFSEADEWW
jgi:hypothetical protein